MVFRRATVTAACCATTMLVACATLPRHAGTDPETHAHHASMGDGLPAFDATISKDSTHLFHDDRALFSYVMRFGLSQAIVRLNELSASNGDCHHEAHMAGRYAYRIVGDVAFKSHQLECHAGGLHGAIEAYFRDHGVENLAGDAKAICSGAGSDRFFSSQCFHGIGHGLMAYTAYELPQALKACDRLNEGKSECYTGVFMENIVGSLASHHADPSTQGKYLSGDPQYPCTIVDEVYKPSCYLLQTSRMIQLFGPNFARIASACSDAATRYQQLCFESMGRDVGGLHRRDVGGLIRACSSAPSGERRIACLNGAVQDLFWDPAGQGVGLQVCRLLSDSSEKNACYSTVFARAVEMLSSESVNTFCDQAEVGYRNSCVKTFR
jgi:hypothetical protein